MKTTLEVINRMQSDGRKGFGVRLAILQYRLTLFIRKRLVNSNYATL